MNKKKKLGYTLFLIGVICAAVGFGVFIMSGNVNPNDLNTENKRIDYIKTDSSNGDNHSHSTEGYKQAVAGTVTELTGETKNEDAYVSTVDDEGTTKVTTEAGFTLEGDLAKTVHSYKSLAEAEETMGYYLGLHNTIKSHENYKLVAMYSIGDKEWYQALFEDETSENSSFTVKTSKGMTAEKLAEAYGGIDTFNSTYFETVEGTGINLVVLSKEIDSGKHNLAYFDTPNGKAYSIFSTDGIDEKIFMDIVYELVENLTIMDDWVY